MPSSRIDFPRILIAGLRGGAGKTILSIGIIAAWERAGQSVAPYKKGPDYIDAGWLALAAGRPCFNLDTFLVRTEAVLFSFANHTLPGQIAVIEGNRGLYDSIDVRGETSSAELAKILKTPVILCIDCTKTTRTMAAVVSGCSAFDPDVPIKGVVLNRVAGARHEANLRRNIEHYCGIPVVGAIPKLDQQNFPERHMGLVPTPEHALARRAVAAAANVAENYLDLKGIETIARDAGAHPATIRKPDTLSPTVNAEHPFRPKIGIVRDAAFQFYYPENIDALSEAGGETVFLSAVSDADFPDIDGLYIGGGFPETHAEVLCENRRFIDGLRTRIEAGLPVYAECGGLMYLGESIALKGKMFPMSGILPIRFGLSERPQGLGYTVIAVDRVNPYFDVGTEIQGHEFRYSRVLGWDGHADDLVFSMKRGTGFADRRDGIRYKNVLATYTHIHAWGVPGWAPALVAKASAYRQSKQADSISF